MEDKDLTPEIIAKGFETISARIKDLNAALLAIYEALPMLPEKERTAFYNRFIGRFGDGMLAVIRHPPMPMEELTSLKSVDA